MTDHRPLHVLGLTPFHHCGLSSSLDKVGTHPISGCEANTADFSAVRKVATVLREGSIDGTVPEKIPLAAQIPVKKHASG